MYPTFHQACVRLNLVDNDSIWDETLQEAVDRQQMPNLVRRLFSCMLLFCSVSDPMRLWEEFGEYMMDDFLHRGLSRQVSSKRALGHVSALLERGGRSLDDFGLPGEHKP